MKTNESFSEIGMSPENLNIIFSRYDFVDFEHLDEGVEGNVYIVRGKLRDSESDILHTFVVKVFDGDVALKENYDEAKKKEECIFVSETAHKFRSEGLPVLPVVKSILKKGDMLFENSLSCLSYPCVFMTYLGDPSNNEKVYNFGSFFLKDVEDDPDRYIGFKEEVEGMARDLAKIHKLGFVMRRLPHDVGLTDKHPVRSLYLMTQNEEGKIKRCLVDLSNLSTGEYYEESEKEEKMKFDRHEDQFNFFNFLKKYKVNIDIEMLKLIYKKEFES
jgi:hypothetical protein